ncbi:hypothetical protein K470DRAFT_267699 [Piedraia hortae CBS 480.64]|uniref:F-box domain-containing protein n=1 Tax=Piedraia hortae CBS 480.64 TaxID=1314780 RepID=A0A6A7CCS6_9PEZI|nr:hypothetical protein K470DRAFT_267699 [Piedraia hortae CBS 480.64]
MKIDPKPPATESNNSQDDQASPDPAVDHDTLVEDYHGHARYDYAMGRFEAALANAKSLIRINRRDGRARLIAVQSLIAIQSYEAAENARSTGLGEAGGKIDELMQEYNLISELLSGVRKVDPLTKMPFELADKILAMLDFDALIRLRLVSKQWASYVDSSRYLWRNADMTDAQQPIQT